MSGSLLSPGSLVSLTDDTMTVSATNGTVPLFIIGTHENKTQPNSTSLASGTITGTGNVVTPVTSQRELINTFGNPIFYTKNGTPQNAYELNEYGLLAAYQYLGLSDSAYILRADVDYYQLAPTVTAPYSSLTSKTFWMNTTTSAWGIFMNDGLGTSTSWNYQTPYVLDSNTNMSWVVRGQVGWPDVSSTTLGDGVTYGGTSYAGINDDSTFTISLGTGQSINVAYETTDTLSDILSAINTAIAANSAFDTVTAEYVSYNSITDNVTVTASVNTDKVYADTAWTIGQVYTNTGSATSPKFAVSPPSAGVTYNVTGGNEITTSTSVNGTTIEQVITIVPVGSSSEVTTVTNTFNLVYATDSVSNITYLTSYTFVEQRQITIEQGIYLQISQSSVIAGLSVSGPAELLELLGLYEPTITTTSQNYVTSEVATKGQKTLTVTGNYTLDADQGAVISQAGSGASVLLASNSTTNYAPNTVLIANPGSGYAANDSVTINGVGVITVNTVSTGVTGGGVVSGSSKLSSTAYTSDNSGSSVAATGGTGTGATFTVTVDTSTTGVYPIKSVAVNNPGSGYVVGDVLTVGESLADFTVTNVTTAVTGGQILTFSISSTLTSTTDMAGANLSSSGGTGTNATFTVTTNKAVTYQSSNLSVSSGGTGYKTNATYYVGPNNDAFTITAVNKSGAITSITPTLDTDSYLVDMSGTYSVTNSIPANAVVLSSTYNNESNTSTLTLDSNLTSNLSANVTVTIVTTTTENTTPSANVTGAASKIPNPSYGNAISGQAGIFAVVSGKAAETSDATTYSQIKIYQKIGGSYIDTGVTNASTGADYTAETGFTWVVVGSEEWRNIQGNSFNFNSTLPTGNYSNGDVIIKTTSANNGTNMVMGYYDPTVGSWASKACNIYSSDEVAGLNAGTSDYTVYAQYQTTAKSNPEAFYSVRVSLSNAWYDISSESVANNVVLYGNSSNANILGYYFQDAEPEGDPEDGTMWFNNDLFVDIMVGDGENWYGYRNYFPNTDVNGVIISGSKPATQSTGDSLVDNDLWIDSSDTENYPLIYRYTAASNTWSKIDNTNHTNGYGIIFEDARWTNDGTTDGSQTSADLAISNYLDPDAPDARLYEKGTLLFNSRASTNNVKVWKAEWFDSEYNGTDYLTRGYNIGAPTSTSNLGSYGPVSSAGRWVTDSGNDESGAPYMGRKAQRQIIVEALKEAITDNDDIRSELMYFTLIACPGYTEVLSNMVELNADKNYTAMVIGDTPARLKSDSASLTAYATNTTAVSDGDDGIVTADSNLAVYYPWGLSTNTDGTSVVVPPSHMALYTIAYSDSVSYPWYAPAGTTRGPVKNASAVGYVDSSGDFVSVTLNQKQNNILYPNNINAILRYPTAGLVIMGDKTRCADSSSALTRINVARLCSYVRYNLTVMTRRFLFEQNITSTRTSAKSLVDKFFTNLVSLNAVTDYVTVCDTSNNTDERIDNNELWIDCAFVPVKTIDFVYVPVRLENTGTDLSSLYSTSASSSST